MSYYPNPAPDRLEDLSFYLYEELIKVKEAINVASDEYKAVRTITESYTVSDVDELILADATSGAITVTLPKAVDGRTIYTKKIDNSNNVTIATTGSETIDGQAQQTISTQWDTVEVISDGSNWFII